MASVFQPVDSLDIPVTGQSITALRTFAQAVDSETIPVTGQSVGEIAPGDTIEIGENLPVYFRGMPVVLAHTSPPGSGIEYISGCNCCQSTIACQQTICLQCPNGYAPAVFNWFIDGGVTKLNDPFGVIYYYPGGIVFANGVTFGGFDSATNHGQGIYLDTTFYSTGEDCVWVSQMIQYNFHSIYWKIYYDSGWKLYVDWWLSNFGVDPYPGPSGTELVFSLSPFTCCPPSVVYDPLNTTGGNRGGFTTTLTLVSGSPFSLADPLTITYGSCGCGTVTVPCCTEPIPRALLISAPGATAPVQSNGLIGQVGYVSSYFWSGQGYGFATFGLYKFVVACIAGPLWNLKIYLIGTPDVLKYNQNSTSDVCYPIYLSFPQSGFDFDGILSGQTFTIDVHR